MKERLDTLIAEAQRRCSLFINEARLLKGMKCVLPDSAVMADALDVE